MGQGMTADRWVVDKWRLEVEDRIADKREQLAADPQSGGQPGEHPLCPHPNVRLGPRIDVGSGRPNCCRRDPARERRFLLPVNILAHSLIVAREMGIPAVCGIAGLTGELEDGQIVRIDGGSGAVVVEGEKVHAEAQRRGEGEEKNRGKVVQLSSSDDESIVLCMRANPHPVDTLFYIDAQCSVVDPYTNRP